MSLSTLSVGLGLLIALPQVFGLLKPREFALKARQFPRSVMAGYLLMGLGTAWFLQNLQAESISDFAAYKKLMVFAFGAIGVLTCIYVKDYLAVRGLAVVMLMLGKLMLDTARWSGHFRSRLRLDCSGDVVHGFSLASARHHSLGDCQRGADQGVQRDSAGIWIVCNSPGPGRVLICGFFYPAGFMNQVFTVCAR
jgi:hypothetical protein